MDTLQNYLDELENNQSTHQESLQLLLASRQGDSVAREKLIKNYLLLVVKEAKKYENLGVPLPDLISEGNLGLIKAIDEKFDPERGAPLVTCARQWIKQSIIRNCMHNNRLVRIPENVSELIRTGRWEGDSYSTFSIDKPNDEGDSFSESIPETSPSLSPFMSEEELLMKKKIERILSYLKGRDAEIVKACYGIGLDEPMEVIEVAEQFNLTSTRINQILRSSIKKMRNLSSEEEPKDVTVITALYGSGDAQIDVTQKVVDLMIDQEIIRSSNRLGGDPCEGVKKSLTITYTLDGEIFKKSFKEGTIVNF